MDDSTIFDLLMKQLVGLEDHTAYPIVKPRFPPAKFDVMVPVHTKRKQSSVGKDAYFDIDLKFLKQPKLNRSVTVHPLYSGFQLRNKVLASFGLSNTATILPDPNGLKLVIKGKTISDEKLIADYDSLVNLYSQKTPAKPVVHVMTTPEVAKLFDSSSDPSHILENGGNNTLHKDDLHNLISKNPQDENSSIEKLNEPKSNNELSQASKSIIIDKNSPSSHEFWIELRELLVKHFVDDAGLVEQEFVDSLIKHI
ncbi:hypothetical protein BB558_002262 [Smittium angustum]|uniref:Uncharacterized protein n=1 Tax=Smittium angustum TaxID=133377 RepID=A0A2U1J958_SMIAN|nr:hypothetical protein BB558_002262 [Smittium angustum]